MAGIDDIFGDDNQNTGTDDDQNRQTATSVFEELVGEGKKFKDQEALAQAKKHSDAYIEQLTTALREASGELQNSDNIDRLIAEIRGNKTPDTAGNKPSDTNTNRDTDTSDNTSQQVSEDLLERLVNKTLTDRERKATADANLSKAIQSLEAKMGDKSGEFLKAKAKELGLDSQRLKSLAQESPTAFTQLLGLEKESPDRQLPRNQFRSESQGQNDSSDRTNSWYINLRRTNRAEYYRPQTQAQMYKDRERLGDKFWQ